MEISTKYTLRNRVWVIRNCKATPIEIKYIMISEQGVQYGDEAYNMVNESECFPSKEDLGKYVMGD